MSVSSKTTAVIGAGPYGLALSAYLRAAGVPTLTFGKPMELWQTMPAGICLKSVWSASSLPDPTGHYSLNRYLEEAEQPQIEPIPRELFLDYARWYQQKLVPDIDPTYIRALARDGSLFRLGLDDGRELSVGRVILATGVAKFAQVPDFARDLPPELAAHTQMNNDLSAFKGRRVAMVGSGQSALEYSALLHEQGAEVEVIARGEFIWHSRVLYERVGPARHLFYPPGDVGPPGINWVVAFPLFFRRLPARIKQPLHMRSIRPAGAKWLRPRVEGGIRLTPHTRIERATPRGNILSLKLSDGTCREVDFLFLGTGYRPDMHRLTFLEPALRQQVQAQHGYPLLDRWFESSVPQLHFAGVLAGQTFGPVCRFISGARIPALQITRKATQRV